MIWLISRLGAGGLIAEILEAVLYLIIILTCIIVFGRT